MMEKDEHRILGLVRRRCAEGHVVHDWPVATRPVSSARAMSESTTECCMLPMMRPTPVATAAALLKRKIASR